MVWMVKVPLIHSAGRKPAPQNNLRSEPNKQNENEIRFIKYPNRNLYGHCRLYIYAIERLKQRAYEPNRPAVYQSKLNRI